MLNKDIKNTFLFIYYAAMMAVLLSWTNPEVAPPEGLRYAFLGALTIPLLFDGTPLTVAVISIFYTISYYGYAFSYMPQSLMIYVVILIVCILLNKHKMSYKSLEGWRSFIVYGIFVIFVNTATSFSPFMANGNRVLLCFLLPFFLTKDWRDSITILEHSFIIISIIMSVQYLVIGDQAVLVHNQDGSGLVRTGWTDPNHYASIIGMGVVISVMLLMELKERAYYSLLYFGAAIVLSIIVVLLNASRGATVSIALSALILLSMSKVKTKYKILISTFVVVMLIGLYYYGYFDLLEVRLAAGDNTAGGRTTIWGKKLDAFFNTSNLLELLFGVGFEKGLITGTNSPLSFHSDYFCTIVDYGFVGFILFITMLITPILKSTRRQRSKIIALSVYLWTVGFSLSPLSEGYVPYYIFLFYIYAKMQMYRQQEVLSRL